MSTQASLDITTGDTSSAAWADAVTSHLNTIETATPAVVFEGKQFTIASQDRVLTRDGSGQDVRTGWYSPTGRTYFSGSSTATIATATTAQVSLGSLGDPDSLYVGWNGSHYVVSGMVGVWIWTVRVVASGSVSATSNVAMVTTGAIAARYPAYVPASSAYGAVSFWQEFVATDTIYVEAFNGSSGTLDYTVTLGGLRIGA